MPNPIGRRLDASYPPDDDENNLCAVDDITPPRRIRKPQLRSAECDTTPDYTTLTLGFSMLGAASGSFTVDRYGQDYYQLGSVWRPLDGARLRWPATCDPHDHPGDPPSPMFWPITSRGLPSPRWREPVPPPV